MIITVVILFIRTIITVTKFMSDFPAFYSNIIVLFQKESDTVPR